MSNSPQIPSATEIQRDLDYMTARWNELPEPAQIELRAFKEGGSPQTARFSMDMLAEGEATEWAESMNERGYNIYAVRNPIKLTCKGSASDGDILAAFFLWADCDDEQSAGNVLRFDGPKWSASVVTGTVPATRAHTYWMLEKPCYDMTEWRAMQETIAAYFGSDGTVVNPSRIMRVGGTVAYPFEHKRKRGYVKERTVIRTQYDDARPPVTLDQMRRVFGNVKTSTKTDWIDTGYTPPLDRERTAIQALQGQEWNNAVLRLVGSYVRKGLSDSEIHALTDPLTLAGYTVEQTRAEVQDIINRTRANPAFEGAVQTEHAPNFDHAPAPTASDPDPQTSGWTLQSAEAFTAGFVAPEYIIDGIIQRGRLYTLTAPTGSGKTAIMLLASTAIATGENFHEKEVEGGDVLFMAGENPDDVRARVIGTMEAQGIDPAKCRMHFIAGTFSIRADMQKLEDVASKLPNLVLIVIDTFAAYFDGDDENSNAQALDFARVARKLTAFPSKPAVVMPAHPVKNATKGNLAPKGGSSLVNEVDGNLTLWNEGGVVTLHWQVKFRGPEFSPLNFELVRHESDRIKDAKGRHMPTILARPVLTLRAIEMAKTNLSLEDKLLLNINDDGALTLQERAAAIGAPHKMKVKRMVEKLKQQRLVRSFRTNLELTKDGERAVEEITSGGKFAAEIDQ